MKKPGKFTFKIYFNERLKNKVNYHGSELSPLYIRLIYNRTSTDLKSYYFNLAGRQKFLTQSSNRSDAISIEDVIKAEKEVLNYINEECLDDSVTTMEDIRRFYIANSLDILSLLEDHFIRYLETFFDDEGYPIFRKLLANSNSYIKTMDLLNDLKSILKPSIYSKIIENAPYYGPPLIPFMSFIDPELMRETFQIYPGYKFESEEVREKFKLFILKKFPSYDSENAISFIKSALITETENIFR